MVILYDTIESLRDFMALGGDVLWAIALVVLIMWTFIVERIWYFSMVHPARMRGAVEAWNARLDTTSWYARRIREMMIAEVDDGVRQSLPVIKTMIAICPLLGLLGTVMGMEKVFDVMAVTGTGNARAMAAGVSQATVPTMAGMVAALSGLFLIARFESRAEQETERLADAMVHH